MVRFQIAERETERINPERVKHRQDTMGASYSRTQVQGTPGSLDTSSDQTVGASYSRTQDPGTPGSLDTSSGQAGNNLDLYLLLLGKTGIGKSGTGNSILGRKAFTSKPNMSSVTVNSKKDVSQFHDGRKLYVVDTPGVADTGLSEQKGKEMFETAIKEAIAMSPQGYHALLLTIRFGSRLTPEDVKVIAYLQMVFGEKFLKKHCIVLLTHGDIFKTDEDLAGVTFLDWCKQQEGPFQTLFEKVKGRVILFDNRGNDEVKTDQRQKLVDTVDELMQGGRRYTNDKFEEARIEMEKIMKEKRKTILSDEMKDTTSLVLAKLTYILEGKMHLGARERDEALTVLKTQSKEQLDKIKEEKPTELLTKMQAILKSAYSIIEQIAEGNKNQEKNLPSKETSSEYDKHEAGDAVAVEKVKKLTEKFQKLRDQSNCSLVEAIFGYLKWPLGFIFSMLTWSK